MNAQGQAPSPVHSRQPVPLVVVLAVSAPRKAFSRWSVPAQPVMVGERSSRILAKNVTVRAVLRRSARFLSIFRRELKMEPVSVWQARAKRDRAADHREIFISSFPSSRMNSFRSEEHTSELQSRENLVCR